MRKTSDCNKKKWKNVTSMKKFISFSKPRLGSPPTKYHNSVFALFASILYSARGSWRVWRKSTHTQTKKQQNPVVTSIVFFSF